MDSRGSPSFKGKSEEHLCLAQNLMWGKRNKVQKYMHQQNIPPILAFFFKKKQNPTGKAPEI